MYSINGNCIVFSDQHFGIKNNSKARLSIVENIFNELLEYVKKNNIKNIISCGDLFHTRSMIDVNVINVAYRCMDNLAKCCHIYLICGNHDAYLKNQIDINSINIFKNTENITIVDKPTQISINNNLSLLVPWLGDISNIEKETYDMLFGHFDISSKFLIQSYINEHSKNAISSKLQQQIEMQFNDVPTNVGDLAGDFVEIVKKNGTIFSGHIHTRKEFMSKGRKFIIVGDPYQQNLGELGNVCGFYEIDSSNNYKFCKLESSPIHVELKMSQVAKNLDEFDFSIVKGNIVHKTYDIDLDQAIDAKITQKINDMMPYEELIPTYDVKLAQETVESNSQEATLIKKSKLEYIKKYIDGIDKKIFEEQKLDKKKLFSIMEEYYNKEVSSK